MKLQHIAFALLTLTATTFLAACKEDKTPPVVTVTSPSDGVGVAAGSTISISGTVTDNKGLKEAIVEITAGSNDSLVYSKAFDISGKSATVTDSYVLNLPSGKLFEVHIDATDEAGNEYGEHAHLHVN